MARSGSGLRGDLWLHLYAVVEGVPSWWRPPAQGVGGRPVFLQHVEPFRLLASSVVSPPIRTPATLAQHHDAIASCLDARSMLPFPFDASLPESDLRPWLEANADAIQAALVALQGSVEMTVRLVRLESGGPTTSVAATLRAFAERLVERAALPQWRYSACGSGVSLGATLAFLVPRGEVQDFLARIAPLASRAAGLAVVPGGPWPAYSFAPSLGVERRAAMDEFAPVARAG